jgi:hypothetical protein
MADLISISMRFPIASLIRITYAFFIWTTIIVVIRVRTTSLIRQVRAVTISVMPKASVVS